MASVGTIKYKNGSSWIDILHPVGSFYFSTSSTSPVSLFGGSWTQVTGAAIRGNTSTGYVGADTTTLTASQLPQHHHVFWGWKCNNEALGYGLNISSSFQDKVLVYSASDHGGYVGGLMNGGG